MDRYRFTLQFPKQTQQQIRAGEFLSKLGNRKSRVIVAALNEYLDAHPDFDRLDSKVTVAVANSFDEGELRAMIARIILEEYSGNICGDVEKVTNEVADSMLDGLDAFY